MNNFRYNIIGTIDCDIKIEGFDGNYPNTLSSDESEKVINSGVEIAPYVAPVKTNDQLQKEAVSAMAAAVIAECRSGTGKLYFSDLNSASMYANAAIQLDTEIYDRAVQLLQWNFAIDTYALDVLFSIEEGGDIPTIEEFIDGLPTV
tara:strand:+ start:70 stop:510 length:441 start_codon:yes stop_codon:yes gene_type:complete